MKIENVKYVPCSQDELWEKVDEIARYLRLTAEFLMNLKMNLQSLLANFRNLFCSKKILMNLMILKK